LDVKAVPVRSIVPVLKLKRTENSPSRRLWLLAENPTKGPAAIGPEPDKPNIWLPPAFISEKSWAEMVCPASTPPVASLTLAKGYGTAEVKSTLKTYVPAVRSVALAGAAWRPKASNNERTMLRAFMESPQRNKPKPLR
jgi:hypothetical protein